MVGVRKCVEEPTFGKGVDYIWNGDFRVVDGGGPPSTMLRGHIAHRGFRSPARVKLSRSDASAMRSAALFFINPAVAFLGAAAAAAAAAVGAGAGGSASNGSAGAG